MRTKLHSKKMAGKEEQRCSSCLPKNYKVYLFEVQGIFLHALLHLWERWNCHWLESGEFSGILRAMLQKSHGEKRIKGRCEYTKGYCSGSRWTSLLDLWDYAYQHAPTITKVFQVFNSSLKKQLLPCLWKLANITPIPKETPFETCNQLRPISLTNVIMRLFERVVVKQELSPVLKSAIDQTSLPTKKEATQPWRSLLVIIIG